MMRASQEEKAFLDGTRQGRNNGWSRQIRFVHLRVYSHHEVLWFAFFDPEQNSLSSLVWCVSFTHCNFFRTVPVLNKKPMCADIWKNKTKKQLGQGNTWCTHNLFHTIRSKTVYQRLLVPSWWFYDQSLITLQHSRNFLRTATKGNYDYCSENLSRENDPRTS